MSDDNFDDNINLNLSNDSEDVQFTASQIIELMENAWLNEKFAPEILPHKSDIVDCLLGQITYMEEKLSDLDTSDFQRSLHQIEIDRLRFLITSYIRTRLEKIEMFVYSILKQEQQRSEKNEDTYLSEQELTFAQTYRDSIDHHFEDVLKFWPGVAPDDWKNDVVVPNVHSFVFAKSNVEVEGVLIDDGNDEDEGLVDLRSGSQMIISYNSISNLIKNEQVKLI